MCVTRAFELRCVTLTTGRSFLTPSPLQYINNRQPHGSLSNVLLRPALDQQTCKIPVSSKFSRHQQREEIAPIAYRQPDGTLANMDVVFANRVIELDSLVLFTILQNLSATTDLKSVACVNSGCRAAAAVRGSPSPPNAATPSQSWRPTAREWLTRALDSPFGRMWRPTRSSPCSSSWPHCRLLAVKRYARHRTSRSWLRGAPSRRAP